MREWLCEVVPPMSSSSPQEFTLEFSRDRKSMSAYCHPTSEENSSPVMFVKVTPFPLRPQLSQQLTASSDTGSTRGNTRQV